MYIFLSWSYVDAAAAAETRRSEWVASLSKKKEDVALAKQITTEVCLPEYANYLKALEEEGDDARFDEFNSNLLSVRFFVPVLGKVCTYQQSKRMAGGDKLPVSLAARAFLLNNFQREWIGQPGYDSHKRITFVGLTGIRSFLKDFAAACAVLEEPVPYDLWATDRIVELESDEYLRKLLDSLAFQSKVDQDAERYRKLLLGWMGTGCSAERDNSVAVAAGTKLGLKES